MVDLSGGGGVPLRFAIYNYTLPNSPLEDVGSLWLHIIDPPPPTPTNGFSGYHNEILLNLPEIWLSTDTLSRIGEYVYQCLCTRCLRLF